MQLETNDCLPQNICGICVKKVIELYSFKEQSRSSEVILKDILHKEYLENLSSISTNEINVVKNEVITVDESDCKEIILEVQKTESDILETNDGTHTHIENYLLEANENSYMESDSLETNKNAHIKNDISETNEQTNQVSQSESDISETNKDTDRSLKKSHRIRKKSSSFQIPQKELKTCDICGKRVIHIREHKKLHSGLKMHECNVCFKRFSIKGNLTQHMVIHTKERTRRHKSTRSEKGPHKCEICKKG